MQLLPQARRRCGCSRSEWGGSCSGNLRTGRDSFPSAHLYSFRDTGLGRNTCPGLFPLTVADLDLPVDAQTDRVCQLKLQSRQRGRSVHVRVDEHDAEGAEMFVSFPDDATMDVESNQAEIAAAVTRAREMLANWR